MIIGTEMSAKSKWLAVLALGWAGGWFSHQYLASPGPGPAPVAGAIDPQGTDRLVPAQAVPGKVQEAGESIGTMLRKGRYHEAVERFSNAPSDSAAEGARAEIIRHLNALLERKDYPNLDRLLSVYLVQEYRDVDVLLIRARSQQAQGDYRSAINTLYEILSREYRAAAINRLRAQIRSLVDVRDTQLQKSRDNRQRLSLYEGLVRLEPDYAPWFLRLAKVQIELHELDAARQSLVLIESDPRVAQQVRGLLDEIEDTVSFEQQMPVSVPLIRSGNHFIVQGWLNDTVPVRLLIDTGASMTLLKTDILRAVGLDEASASAVQIFNTANGPVRGAVYRVNSFSIGNQEARNLEIAGLALPEMETVDGLLGMNYLARFRFYIDQERQELRLSAPQ